MFMLVTVCTSKHLRGSNLLNLEYHAVAQRFNLLKGTCIDTQPWVEIICHFVEEVVIYHDQTQITTSLWHVVTNT